MQNGQTFGQDGTFHQDDTLDNAITVCMYLNNVTETDGPLIIKVPNEIKMVAIEPIHNRLVIFPSKYFHKGMSFNRYTSGLRVCLAWKCVA